MSDSKSIFPSGGHVDLNTWGNVHQNSNEEENTWKILLRKMAVNTIIYGILSTAVVVLMLTFALPICRTALGHWPGNALCGSLTVLMNIAFSSFFGNEECA